MKLFLNYKFITVILLTFFCFFIVWILIRKPTIDVLNSQEYVIHAFSDSLVNGTSTSSVTHKNNAIDVFFELKKGYEFPFAGVQIERADAELFDISDYTVHILIETKNDMRLSVRYNQFIPSYSDSINTLTYALYVKTFTIHKGLNTFECKTKDINEIPEWWYAMNPRIVNNVPSHNLTQTKYMWLYTESTIPLNTPYQFTIRKFTLSYSVQPLLVIFLYVSVLYYVILLIVWRFKKQSISRLFLPIEHITIPEKSNNDFNRIVTYIAKEYSNPDLKLSHVAKSIGIQEDQISEILKHHVHVNFKQYVNKIRIEEALHLLQESKLSISEIAFAVGYNNVQHFNRVFKELMNCSPGTYRESI